MIADVSDKGMGAALYMTVTSTLIHSNAREILSPAKVLQKVNQQLLIYTENGMFVTAVYIVLNIHTGAFVYANAGHNYPLFFKPSKNRVDKLPKGNLALGIMEDIQYEEHHFNTQPGDALFLYTDGITENFSPEGEDFGEERFKSLVKSFQSGTLPEFIDIIIGEVGQFHGDHAPSDDITLLAIQRKQK